MISGKPSNDLFFPDAEMEEDHFIDRLRDEEVNTDPPDPFGLVDPYGNEDFQIDDNIFDIQHFSSPPPFAPPSARSGFDVVKSVNVNVNPKPKMSPQASPRFDLNFPKESTIITKEQPKMIEPPYMPGGDATDMYQDDLAQLEAWLHSDAVEITNDNSDSD